jgi:hypothetical protein
MAEVVSQEMQFRNNDFRGSKKLSNTRIFRKLSTILVNKAVMAIGFWHFA